MTVANDSVGAVDEVNCCVEDVTAGLDVDSGEKGIMTDCVGKMATDPKFCKRGGAGVAIGLKFPMFTGCGEKNLLV